MERIPWIIKHFHTQHVLQLCIARFVLLEIENDRKLIIM